MTEGSALNVDADGVARVSGELTFETVTGLYDDMEERFSGTGPISVVDLEGVSGVDSAGLALLLEWQARQRHRGRELTITNAPDSLMRLARLCEAIDLLRISDRGPPT